MYRQGQMQPKARFLACLCSSATPTGGSEGAQESQPPSLPHRPPIPTSLVMVHQPKGDRKNWRSLLLPQHTPGTDQAPPPPHPPPQTCAHAQPIRTHTLPHLVLRKYATTEVGSSSKMVTCTSSSPGGSSDRPDSSTFPPPPAAPGPPGPAPLLLGGSSSSLPSSCLSLLGCRAGAWSAAAGGPAGGRGGGCSLGAGGTAAAAAGASPPGSRC